VSSDCVFVACSRAAPRLHCCHRKEDLIELKNR
jgi:hypothetical protein